MFSEVCEAVRHANMKETIHRDIKPSKVQDAVKEDRPETKVVDFGVAHVIISTLWEKR